MTAAQYRYKADQELLAADADNDGPTYRTERAKVYATLAVAAALEERNIFEAENR